MLLCVLRELKYTKCYSVLLNLRVNLNLCPVHCLTARISCLISKHKKNKKKINQSNNSSHIAETQSGHLFLKAVLYQSAGHLVHKDWAKNIFYWVSESAERVVFLKIRCILSPYCSIKTPISRTRVYAEKASPKADKNKPKTLWKEKRLPEVGSSSLKRNKRGVPTNYKAKFNEIVICIFNHLLFLFLNQSVKVFLYLKPVCYVKRVGDSWVKAVAWFNNNNS